MNNIIDFHTHIFPERTAPKATKNIGDFYNFKVPLDGTLKTLKERMRIANIDHTVLLTVATSDKSQSGINEYLSKFKVDVFYPFGAIYPSGDKIEKEVNHILDLGLYGIKLHPDMQQLDILSDGVIKLFEIVDNRLPILIHLGDPRQDLSCPIKAKKLCEMFPNQTIIGAHLGGFFRWEESFEHLCSTNIIFDTSSAIKYLEKDTVLKFFDKHGIDKIIFGSDYPISDPVAEIQILDNLALSKNDKEKILYSNAAKILKLKEH